MGCVTSELESLKPALRRAAARAIGPEPCRRDADELAARLLLEIGSDPALARFRKNWSITAVVRPGALLFDLRSHDKMVTIDASVPTKNPLVYASVSSPDWIVIDFGACDGTSVTRAFARFSGGL